MTLIIILTIDVVLFLGQVGVNNVASEFGTSSSDFFNYDKSFIHKFDESNYTVITNSSGIIPKTEDSISTETGNVFTDSARSIKSWLGKASGSVVSGWDYFTSFLGGPMKYLNNIGAPIEVSFALGALWYGLTLLLLILLIFNR